MLPEEVLEQLGDRGAALFQAFEQDLIADIVRRIKKTGRYTETAELQAQAMMAEGVSPAEILKEVMRILQADDEYQKEVAQNTLEWKKYVKAEIQAMREKAKEEGDDIIANAGDMSFNYDLSMWEQNGEKLTKDSAINRMISEMSKDTAGTFKNLTKSMGFKGAYSFVTLQNAYIRYLDKAVVKMASGTFSYDRAVEDAVREMAHSGLRSVDYASGRTYQLDTAARMCVRTSCHQLSAKMSMHNCEKMGTDLVEVTAHWGARPEHALWQGKIYSRSGKNKKYPPFSECHYGAVDGLCGVNCHHTFYPFFEGVSEPTKWEKEPEPKEYNGKTYTYYDMTQKQRQMERKVRETKREIEAKRAIGGDTDDLEAAKRKQIAEYHKFSDEMGIRPKDNRLRVIKGSSDLTKTKTMKDIKEMYSGYTATIPKTWEKGKISSDIILSGTNPKYIAHPKLYDKNEIKYNTNCVNSVVAYEMRNRGYKVIAGKANSKLRENPLLAWEDVKKIEVKDNITEEISKKMREWGKGARACVCEKGRSNANGHAFIAEFDGKGIKYIDSQLGTEYNINRLNTEDNEVMFFRIDDATISNRGVNACEKELAND